MNRKTFMEQLARLLAELPENEKEEALRYYDDYFEEAGPENEGKVIQELGSPGKVAGIIRANLDGSQCQGEYTERGYRERNAEECRNGLRTAPGKKRGVGSWVLLIVLAVFLSPVLLGTAGGLLGLVAGVIGLLAGIIITCLAGGGGFFIGGCALIVQGIVHLFHSPAEGMVRMGGGFIFVSVGLLLIILFLWMVFLLMPRLFRAVMDFCSRIAHRGRGGKRT